MGSSPFTMARISSALLLLLVPPALASWHTPCCTNRDLGYQTCDTNAWCAENPDRCDMCGGVVMSVPLARNGCCTYGDEAWGGGGDCSGRDTRFDMFCQYKQSDCEGSCGGTWQPF